MLTSKIIGFRGEGLGFRAEGQFLLVQEWVSKLGVPLKGIRRGYKGFVWDLGFRAFLNLGALLGGFHSKAYCILGSILGCPFSYGNYPVVSVQYPLTEGTATATTILQ